MLASNKGFYGSQLLALNPVSCPSIVSEMEIKAPPNSRTYLGIGVLKHCEAHDLTAVGSV